MADLIPMVEMAGDDAEEEEVWQTRREDANGATDESAVSLRRPPPLKTQLSLAYIPAHLSDEDEADTAAPRLTLTVGGDDDDDDDDAHHSGSDASDGEDSLETKWRSKRLALVTDGGSANPRRASYEVTPEGTLRTDLYELRKTGFKRTTMLRKKLRREAAHDGHPSPLAHRAAFDHLSSDTLEQMGVLGRGASGQVTQSLHVPSMTVVALKSIDVLSKSRRAQLLQELTALDTLECEHIVEFYGAYYEEGHVFLALEFMDRGAVDSIVRSLALDGSTRRPAPTATPLPAHRRLDEKVLSNAMKQILLGLNYLHSRNQLHRDIKPGNFLVHHSGEVKLADFGLTSSVEAARGRDSFVGTTIYMSPERITGNEYSLPSDIWSIGMSLTYMATGSSPVSTQDGYWGIVMSINDDFDPRLDPAVYSPTMIDFITQCMYKEPDRRWTCAQLLAHPFITEGPSSIAETLPFWPAHLNMGVDRQPDLRPTVREWRAKQLNRKASMRLRRQGERSTILTHRVYKEVDASSMLSEEFADPADASDSDDGIAMLPRSFADKSSSSPREKRSHARILRRKNTRDEQQLNLYVQKLYADHAPTQLADPLMEEADEDEVEPVHEDDRRQRRRVAFTMEELACAAASPYFHSASGATSPSPIASPAHATNRRTAHMHIADAMYMVAPSAMMDAKLYSYTPDASVQPSPHMSPAMSPSSPPIGVIPESAVFTLSPVPSPTAATADKQHSPSHRRGPSDPTPSLPPYVRSLRVGLSQDFSAPITPCSPPLPPAALSPKADSSAGSSASASTVDSSRTDSSASTPHARGHRQSRIVNGNLVVFEKSLPSPPITPHTRPMSLAAHASEGMVSGEPTVLSITPLLQLSSRDATPVSYSPSSAHRTPIGSPTHAAAAIKLRKAALDHASQHVHATTTPTSESDRLSPHVADTTLSAPSHLHQQVSRPPSSKETTLDRPHTSLLLKSLSVDSNERVHTHRAGAIKHSFEGALRSDLRHISPSAMQLMREGSRSAGTSQPASPSAAAHTRSRGISAETSLASMRVHSGASFEGSSSSLPHRSPIAVDVHAAVTEHLAFGGRYGVFAPSPSTMSVMLGTSPLARSLAPSRSLSPVTTALDRPHPESMVLLPAVASALSGVNAFARSPGPSRTLSPITVVPGHFANLSASAGMSVAPASQRSTPSSARLPKLKLAVDGDSPSHDIGRITSPILRPLQLTPHLTADHVMPGGLPPRSPQPSSGLSSAVDTPAITPHRTPSPAVPTMVAPVDLSDSGSDGGVVVVISSPVRDDSAHRRSPSHPMSKLARRTSHERPEGATLSPLVVPSASMRTRSPSPSAGRKMSISSSSSSRTRSGVPRRGSPPPNTLPFLRSASPSPSLGAYSHGPISVDFDSLPVGRPRLAHSFSHSSPTHAATRLSAPWSHATLRASFNNEGPTSPTALSPVHHPMKKKVTRLHPDQTASLPSELNLPAAAAAWDFPSVTRSASVTEMTDSRSGSPALTSYSAHSRVKLRNLVESPTLPKRHLSSGSQQLAPPRSHSVTDEESTRCDPPRALSPMPSRGSVVRSLAPLATGAGAAASSALRVGVRSPEPAGWEENALVTGLAQAADDHDDRYDLTASTKYRHAKKAKAVQSPAAALSEVFSVRSAPITNRTSSALRHLPPPKTGKP